MLDPLPNDVLVPQTIAPAACTLLADIAGDARPYALMQQTGSAKYRETKKRLSAAQAQAHLQGKHTVAASLLNASGTARAVCYDADTTDDWSLLEEAARLLAAHRLSPLLERSPAGRGGHLWLIFTYWKDAAVLLAGVEAVAPCLVQIRERWPAESRVVRLPGGRYVRDGHSAWCPLFDAQGNQLAFDGQSAAQVLLAAQCDPGYLPKVDVVPRPQQQVDACGFEPQPDELDLRFHQKYGSGEHLPFKYTPKHLNYLLSQLFSADDILPTNAQGFALAHWRGERTPSVHVHRYGYTDFGTHGRDTNEPASGDILDAFAKQSGLPNPQAFAVAARLFNEAGEAFVVECASAGQPVPEWLAGSMTARTRALYTFHYCEPTVAASVPVVPQMPCALSVMTAPSESPLVATEGHAAPVSDGAPHSERAAGLFDALRFSEYENVGDFLEACIALVESQENGSCDVEEQVSEEQMSDDDERRAVAEVLAACGEPVEHARAPRYTRPLRAPPVFVVQSSQNKQTLLQ